MQSHSEPQMRRVHVLSAEPVSPDSALSVTAAKLLPAVGRHPTAYLGLSLPVEKSLPSLWHTTFIVTGGKLTETY